MLSVAADSCETEVPACEPFGGSARAQRITSNDDNEPTRRTEERPDRRVQMPSALSLTTAAASLDTVQCGRPQPSGSHVATSSAGSFALAGRDRGAGKLDYDQEDDNDCVVVDAAASAGDKENNIEKGDRLPPRKVVPINNLSDRQYCCVWSIEVHEDGYRPDVARTMLAAVARHVNPILRERGWRVKRLIESTSRTFLGCCHGNGRSDADAASVNIQLNLRTQPDRHCRQFRTFPRVLGVMLHEITHTSIGLEDIHPPAFYELLNEIRKQYRHLLASGAVAAELDSYGCNSTVVVGGAPQRIDDAARQVDREQMLGLARALQPPISGQAAAAPVSLDEEGLDAGDCGASKRRRCGGRRKRPLGKLWKTTGADKRPKQPPLRKGAKMVDLRTKEGKKARETKESSTSRELAARAALRRLRQAGPHADTLRAPTDAPRFGRSHSGGGTGATDDEGDSQSASSDDEDIAPHARQCSCRSCRWDKLLCRETARDS